MITLLNLDVVARSEGRVFRMLFSPAMGYIYDSQQTMRQYDGSRLSYLALEQQPRDYDGRAEQSQRCEWKNLVVGAARTLGWCALRADGAPLFVAGDRGNQFRG